MDVRHTTDPLSFRTMSSEHLRRLFLIDTLFTPGEVPMVYSDADRSIIGSAVPVAGALELRSSRQEMAAEYFTERRELGVINIGGAGTIRAGGRDYPMQTYDALYIGRETPEVRFLSAQGSEPAQFYFVSYPAHRKCPTVRAPISAVEAAPLGSPGEANGRIIHKYIHPKGIASCQLVMGLTELLEGSVWNTMPPHTHQRRTEVYMYFGLPPGALVFHMMGEPSETRHVVVRDRQAVLSPSWSIHAGVGTRAYMFIWAMGGENQVFDDMDGVAPEELR
jgi:4-deoxy-L-threo-5-hexosulose-uronate ketol-isomerase